MSNIPSNREPAGVFLWARCGGGHRTAKQGLVEQKKQEYALNGKTLNVSHDYDITGEKILNSIWIPFLGKLGDLGVNAWDNAQKTGNLSFLKRYASLGWIAEIIFYPLVYFKVKRLLQDLKVEPEFIISTQAFCIKAIAHAVHSVNRNRKWKMKLDVYLTDMPSKNAIHFFPSIRRAVQDDRFRNLIRLHAPKPILKDGQTEKVFWEKYCGKVKVITDKSLPLRKEFLNTAALKEKLEKPVVDIPIALNRPSEARILQGTKATFTEKQAKFSIKDEDKVGFLMLGSQPTTQSVLNWLDTFVQGASSDSQKNPTPPHRYLFLYCGAPHGNTKNPLLEAVEEEIETLRGRNKLPSHCTIVPFTHQDANTIALLMARADATITRSGGLTSMEILHLAESDIPQRKDKLTLIHSEGLAPPSDQNIVLSRKRLSTIFHEVQKRVREEQTAIDKSTWESIKKEIRYVCQEKGLSRSDSTSVADSIMKLYADTHNKTTQAEQAAELKEFLDFFVDVSRRAIKKGKAEDRESKIAKAIAVLKKKQKFSDLSVEELRERAIEKVLIDEGIVLWEASNAKYLKEKVGAHITSPEYVGRLLREKFFTP